VPFRHPRYLYRAVRDTKESGNDSDNQSILEYCGRIVFRGVALSVSLSGPSTAGFRLRREITFPILVPCGGLFSSGQNGTPEASRLGNEEVTTDDGLDGGSTTLDGTGILGISCLFSACKIWLFDFN
jgi:hypothetical protein